MGNRDLVTNTAALTTFRVGDIVDVAKDMQPGVNRIGGRAKVMVVEGSGASERYDVKYITEIGGEKSLGVTALTAAEAYGQGRGAGARKRQRPHF